MIAALLLAAVTQTPVPSRLSPTPALVSPVRTSGESPNPTEIARKCHGVRDHGVPILSVKVGSDGVVKSTHVLRSCGCAAADQLVVAAVMTWKYKPATSNGQPVPFSMTV